MANVSTIISLIGFYDNFEEPEPAWNRPETLIGIAVPFLVRTPTNLLGRPGLMPDEMRRLYHGSASRVDYIRDGK
jgi:hypothetical protein